MKLPDPPTDKLPLVLSRKLEHMNSAVQRSLGDLPTEHGVKDNWSALARAFSAFIHKSRPELLFDKDASKTHNKSETPKGSNVGAGDPVSPTPSRGRSGMAASVISLDSDDEEAPPSGIKSFGKRLADNGLSTPRKRQKPHATANVDWFGVPEGKRQVFCALDCSSRHANSSMQMLLKRIHAPLSGRSLAAKTITSSTIRLRQQSRWESTERACGTGRGRWINFSRAPRRC